MKKSIILTAIMVLFAFCVNAQNDTMYIMKAGVVVKKFNVNNQVDSIVFYMPTTGDAVINSITNPITGRVWMDRNLGASQVATSSTDAAAYGDLYQWGRATDGHQIRTSGTTATLSNSDTPGHGDFILASGDPYDWRSPKNDMLWQGVSGTNNPCPSGYRIPTVAEWTEERDSWGSASNSTGAFASPLKLPMAGYRDNSNGEIINVGTFGSYWSSTVNESKSYSLDFTDAAANLNFDSRAFGTSVRCIKEEATTTFTDMRDGNVYQTVTINTQVWMAENLKYLPSVVGPATGLQTTPYYYVYGYDGTSVSAAKATVNYTTYGVLYNWSAAMAGSTSSAANPSGVKGVCPAGWHLPSDAEWTQLTDYLGGESGAGGKLKEMGTTHWNSPNTGATNETGFTALPGGSRNVTCAFNGVGSYGYWWSATEGSAGDAWYRDMSYNDSSVDRDYYFKEVGFSVRCLRD